MVSEQSSLGIKFPGLFILGILGPCRSSSPARPVLVARVGEYCTCAECGPRFLDFGGPCRDPMLPCSHAVGSALWYCTHAHERVSQLGDSCAVKSFDKGHILPLKIILSGFQYGTEDGDSLQDTERERGADEGSVEVVGGGDSTTCTIENPSNLVQRHLEWERVYHQFRVFLTITFLLRFGRAGKGDLSWWWRVGRLAGWAGRRQCGRSAYLCPRHPMSNAHPQKTRHPEKFHATPHTDARHNHPLCGKS